MPKPSSTSVPSCQITATMEQTMGTTATLSDCT